VLPAGAARGRPGFELVAPDVSQLLGTKRLDREKNIARATLPASLHMWA